MALTTKDIVGCTASYTTVAVGVASAVYLAASTQRIGITVYPANLVRATFRWNAAAVLDEQLTVQAAGIPLMMDVTAFSQLMGTSLNAIASVVGPTNFGSTQILRPT